MPSLLLCIRESAKDAVRGEREVKLEGNTHTHTLRRAQAKDEATTLLPWCIAIAVVEVFSVLCLVQRIRNAGGMLACVRVTRQLYDAALWSGLR